MITPETRHQFIRQIAWAFSGTDFREDRDEVGGIALVWEKDGVSVGAGVSKDDAWVFFEGCNAPVDSGEDAIGLLAAIFADEIVAVGAYEKGVWVSEALANTCDLDRPPHLLVPLLPGHIARIDELRVCSWSGKLDGSRTVSRDDQ